MNTKAFTPEEVQKGLHTDLINYLLDYNTKSEDDYYDIHITTDGYCMIIEWEECDYDKRCYVGEFKYVTSEQVVMLEKIFPDNHYELCYDENDYQEKLAEFLQENPNWVKTEYGTWRNTKEEL